MNADRISRVLTGQVLAAGILLLCFESRACAQEEIKSRVNDYAGVLRPEVKTRLEERLLAHERETTNQIAVLIVKSLDGTTPEQYAERAFTNFKLGVKGRDNGVLLLFARAERQVRIEVGLGLQGVLTDARAGEIIRERMAPHGKKDDFNAAIEAGVTGIEEAVRGEFTAQNPAAGASSGGILIVVLIALGCGGVFVLFFVLLGRSEECGASASYESVRRSRVASPPASSGTSSRNRKPAPERRSQTRDTAGESSVLGSITPPSTHDSSSSSWHSSYGGGFDSGFCGGGGMCDGGGASGGI